MIREREFKRVVLHPNVAVEQFASLHGNGRRSKEAARTVRGLTQNLGLSSLPNGSSQLHPSYCRAVDPGTAALGGCEVDEPIRNRIQYAGNTGAVQQGKGVIAPNLQRWGGLGLGRRCRTKREKCRKTKCKGSKKGSQEHGINFKATKLGTYPNAGAVNLCPEFAKNATV